jgi:hypothetical protein
MNAKRVTTPIAETIPTSFIDLSHVNGTANNPAPRAKYRQACVEVISATLVMLWPMRIRRTAQMRIRVPFIVTAVNHFIALPKSDSAREVNESLNP